MVSPVAAEATGAESARKDAKKRTRKHPVTNKIEEIDFLSEKLCIIAIACESYIAKVQLSFRRF